MKKYKKILIIVCAGVLTVALLVTGTFIYSIKYHKTKIYQEISPDSQYTVTLYQIGDPKWSFGSVKAQLKLRDATGKTQDKQTFGVNNDGTGLYADNVEEIRWLDTYVEVDCRGSDDLEPITHVLEY